MRSQQLTNHQPTAKTRVMQDNAIRKVIGAVPVVRPNRAVSLGVLVAGALALGGCISVNAPDKPIVIELNINIKQEVVYRLAADAGKTIDDNAAIF
jgi:hypothetical protein